MNFSGVIDGGLNGMNNWQSDTMPDMTQVVESYWQELRRGQIVPYRSEVDPRRIEDALSCAFIAEKVSDKMARLRIAGTDVNDVLGMETRGMPLSALIEPASRPRFVQALAEVFERPALVRAALTAPRGLGRPRFDARLVMLPMRDDHGQVTRLLGCLDVSGKIGRPPRRFDIAGLDVETLGPQVTGPRQSHTPSHSGMAEAQRGYDLTRKMDRGAPEQGRETRVPYLRVIDND